MSHDPIDPLDLPPLRVKCTDTRCDDGLHCFRQKRRKRTDALSGPCRECQADLVDWTRAHSHAPEDRAYLYDSLRRELIRHHFWHLPIDEKARDAALRKGRRAMPDAVVARLKSSVGLSSDKLFRDGIQTKMEGNIIFYAQHATASCCRKCIECWHDIPMDRNLSDDEIAYLTDLALRFIDERMPDLPPDPQKIPRRRKSPSPAKS